MAPTPGLGLQRALTPLLTRTVIAGSTLVFARSLYQSAKNYADNKK